MGGMEIPTREVVNEVSAATLTSVLEQSSVLLRVESWAHHPGVTIQAVFSVCSKSGPQRTENALHDQSLVWWLS